MAKNREYKDKVKVNETKEEADAKKARESAQRKARRHAAKAAKLAATNPQPSEGLSEFQRIQTVPKGLSHKGGLPRRHDVTPSSELDSMSEYEKIRQRNIEERNELFKSIFPFGPSHSHSTTSTAKKSVIESENTTSDDDFEVNVGTIQKRKLPKRICTIQRLSQQNCPKVSIEDEDNINDSDASLDALIDTLVEDAETSLTQNYHDDSNNKLENVENRFKTDDFANKLNSILTRPVYKPLQDCFFIQRENVIFDNLASLCDDFGMPPLSYPAHLEFLYDELSEYYQKHKKSVLGRKTKDAKRKANERKTESGLAYDQRMAENSERLEFESEIR